MFKIPKTRYQGSKAKMLQYLLDVFKHRVPNAVTVLDLFGGTSILSLVLKQNGFNVVYNDIMTFNVSVAETLLNSTFADIPNDNQIDRIFEKDEGLSYRTTIETTFENVYYTTEENKQLDIAIQNINAMGYDDIRKHVLLYLLVQSCIAKRPYNLFHRKNLSMRFKDVERSFGNKKTWDTSFVQHMRKFRDELLTVYRATCNPVRSEVLNESYDCIASNTIESIDTVYIDTPYFKSNSPNSDYIKFYHFLEGMVNYDKWESMVDMHSPHRMLNAHTTNHYVITDCYEMFSKLIHRFKNKNIVISYRADGVPSIEDIQTLLLKVKSDVFVERFDYKYALSKQKSQECLIVGLGQKND